VDTYATGGSMKIIGKTTINPILFYSGKICGYLTWLVLLGYLLNVVPHPRVHNANLQLFSILILVIGLIIVTLSLIDLGKSTRLGLPTEKTILKTNGIYRFSRNPMYFGFNLLTIASMLYWINIIVIILGIYSIITYHLIILGEEKFLEERFGDEYFSYKNKVRRYI
jgi:protein-S-isoprenylcysteine O-methyltransferase Ste14